MDAVKKDIEALVGKELKAANEKFPLFNSAHEGYAVILEEFEELKDETQYADTQKDNFWKAVKENNNEGTKIIATILRNTFMRAAVEAIQAAAMCEKFKMSLNVEQKAESNSEPKNPDRVYCKDCDYLNTDGDRPFCCHRNMSTNRLDDWCYHGKKRE